MRRLAFLPGLLLAACSSTENSRPPASTGFGDDAGLPSNHDAAVLPEAKAEAQSEAAPLPTDCISEPAAIQGGAAADAGPSGYEIRGTVNFVQDVLGGKYITVAYVRDSSYQGMSMATGVAGIAAGSSAYGAVTFSFKNLEPGSYRLFATVKPSSQSNLEVGDLGGYYPGSTEAPIVHGTEADDLELVDKSLCNVNWGIGFVTCLSRYGDTCLTDEDCRGTVCECAGGPDEPVRQGMCNSASNLCEDNVDCAAYCPGDGGVSQREAECLGTIHGG